MSGSNYSIKDQEATHFLTFTIVEWVDVFTRKECKQVIVDSLNYCIKEKGLQVYAWCLMSNHLHLVASAAKNRKLSHIVRDFKKFTAKEIIEWCERGNESRKDWMLYRFAYNAMFRKNVEKYHVWDDDNHAMELNTPELLWQKIHYTHNNPVRAMIVDEVQEYLFSSARDYAGMKGLVDVIVL